ncbi:major facilitator superfamily domain-containing protein [Amanita rubescens]|nr:major facilitator superfamily domain-containing protein [Amanita rubescens]KAF8346011.1 major facilitator superfamily domain-containing protein [Amanita rubescens]
MTEFDAEPKQISPTAKGDDSKRRLENLERKTLRQIDLRLVYFLGFLCALDFMDRANLGIARVAGMGEDLHINVGSRYSVLSLVQLPSNLFVRQIGAKNFLGFCVVSWGVVQLSMGFVRSWGYLMLCRVLLGAMEAGFFPALLFIISTWYIRHEVQKRLAALWFIAILAGGLSPILAYLISLLGGKFGITAWSWIFIIEGAITIVCGLLSWRYLPDFPDQNQFLDAEQTELILKRIEEDRGDSVPDVITGNKVKSHLLDWKLWAFGLMYFCATVPGFANGFFITIILKSMGWNIRDSMLLSAPPFIVAGMNNMIFAWISDKIRHRAAFIAMGAISGIIGLTLTGFVIQPNLRYAGLFLSTAGSTMGISGILAYSSNNVISHSKKAVMSALVVSFGAIGGIFTSAVFRQEDFPRYIPGIYASIACQILLLLLLAGTTMHFWSQNSKARIGSSVILEGQPGFRYTM